MQSLMRLMRLIKTGGAPVIASEAKQSGFFTVFRMTETPSLRLLRSARNDERSEARSNLRYLFALCALITVGFIGCAAQPAPRVEYIDRDCTKAADFAPALWLPVRWITIEVLSPGEAIHTGETADSRPSLRLLRSARYDERSNLYVCTPDGEALLGNLIRFREVK